MTMLQLLLLLVFMEQVIGANRGSAKLALFLRVTDQGQTDTENGFWETIAVSAILGAKHCQEKNGTITSALSKSELSACGNIVVDFDAYDTQSSSSHAVRQFLNIANVVDAVVGAAYSSVSIPLSTVASVSGRTTTSYASTSPLLSHDGTSGSLFTRVLPSDTETAEVLCYLLQKKGVKNVGMIFIDDQYGTGYRDAVSAYCKALGIVVHATSFTETETSIDFALEFIQSRSLNIIITIAFDSSLTTIFEIARSKGLLGSDNLYLVSDGITADGITQYLDTTGDVNILSKIMRVQAFGANAGPQYSEFTRVWQSLDTAADAAYFSGVMPGILNISVGFFERTLPSLSDFAPFAYDAVVSTCRAVCLAAGDVSGRDMVPGKSNGNDVYKYLVQDSFEGVSGIVEINNATSTRTSDSATFVSQVWRLIGANNNSTAGRRRRRLQSYSVEALVAGVWEQGSWNLDDEITPSFPVDVRFSTNYNYLNQAGKITTVVLATLLIIICCVVIVWIYLKRKTRIMSRAQPTILQLFVLGIIISTISTYFMGLEDANPSNVSESLINFSCMATFWFWSIGTAMTFGALSCRLYRIHKIFHNKALRKIKITNNDLYLTIAGICSVDVLILIIWTAVSPLTYSRTVLATDIFGNALVTYGACSSQYSTVFMGLIFAYQILLFVVGAVISYMVRKVDSDYQESQHIIISLVSQCQLYLIGFPIIFVFSEESSNARFLVTFCIVFLNNTVLMAVLFLPKYRALKKNVDHAGSYTSGEGLTTQNNHTAYERTSDPVEMYNLRRANSSRLFMTTMNVSTQTYESLEDEIASEQRRSLVHTTSSSPRPCAEDMVARGHLFDLAEESERDLTSNRPLHVFVDEEDVVGDADGEYKSNDEIETKEGQITPADPVNNDQLNSVGNNISMTLT